MTDIGQTLGSSTDFTAPRVDVILSMCYMNGFLGASFYVLHDRALSLISDTPAVDVEIIARCTPLLSDRVKSHFLQ